MSAQRKMVVLAALDLDEVDVLTMALGTYWGALVRCCDLDAAESRKLYDRCFAIAQKLSKGERREAL